MTKRFEIVKSKLIKDGWVISDKLKQFTFPTLKGDKRALVSYCKALNELAEENEQLKKQRAELFIRERDTKNELREQQERNDRQAKQLDNIYNLIEKEDWKTLKGIIQEFQECEEQLQSEWKCYE